jgi:glycosyltransferase involved in cell wall biosynthesis
LRRILAITPNPPLPMLSGDSIRYYNLIVQLARRGWDISLFSLARQDAPGEADLLKLRDHCSAVTIHPFHKPASSRFAQLASDTIRRRPFHDHFLWSADAQAALDRAFDLGQFDVLFVHLMHMYRYVAGRSSGATVLDTHNAEWLRLQSMIDGNPRSPRALYARTQLGPVQTLERTAVRDVACTLAVSPEDLDYFRGLGARRAELVPNGVDLETHDAKAQITREPGILFLASLSYGANLDALLFLIDDILPHCRRTDAHLDIVGSNPPVSLPRIASKSPIRAVPVGEVGDTRPYIDRNRLMVVPLRYGGGTRLKILEGLAQGIPVISTSIGCSGLGLRHLKEIIIADKPEEFAAWIDRLLEDTDLCQRLASQGRQKVEQQFGWSGVADKLHIIMKSIDDGQA